MFSKRRPRINAEGAQFAKSSFGDPLACSVRSAFKSSLRPRAPLDKDVFEEETAEEDSNAEVAEVAEFLLWHRPGCRVDS
jgi:hypothetical protein